MAQENQDPPLMAKVMQIFLQSICLEQLFAKKLSGRTIWRLAENCVEWQFAIFAKKLSGTTICKKNDPEQQFATKDPQPQSPQKICQK